MKKSIHFIPSSLVCSVAIDLTVEDGVIREVCFEGGCSGNLQGISMLVRGMKVEEVIERLEGIQCGLSLIHIFHISFSSDPDGAGYGNL